MVETYCFNNHQTLVVLIVIIHVGNIFCLIFSVPDSNRDILQWQIQYKTTTYTEISTYRLKILLLGFI